MWVVLLKRGKLKEMLEMKIIREAKASSVGLTR